MLSVLLDSHKDGGLFKKFTVFDMICDIRLYDTMSLPLKNWSFPIKKKKKPA